ncbi:MAG: hypothetical protein IKA36_02950 [Clostridia bacterium]|nr:hypothetical protein [Clostridia bacterium]
MKKLMTLTEVLKQRSMIEKKLNARLACTQPRLYGSNDDGGTEQKLLIDVMIESRGKNAKGISKEEVEEQIKANGKSIKALIENYSKLTMIKNMANATTIVDIAGKSYTVAEALAYNNETVKKNYSSLLAKLKSDYAAAQKVYEDYMTKQFSEENKNNYLKSVLSEVERNDPATVQAQLDKFDVMNRAAYIDPLHIVSWINELNDWYTEFYGTINFKLSEINAQTYVVVDLDEEENFWRYAHPSEVESKAIDEQYDRDISPMPIHKHTW